jgi:ABC-type proline/glycine betaine transport system substrate-binding protein
MPCDTIQTTQVTFLEKNTDVKLLAKALKKMGYSVQEVPTGLVFSNYKGQYSYDKRTGALTLPEGESIDAVKRAYAEEVVSDSADQFGWQISWATNEQGEREATVEKRC